MDKKLKHQIETKLEKLQELLDSITEAQAIDPNDPDTWDSDTLYNLTANLQKTLTLLEDKKSNQLDQYGEPIILEPGLGSLIDTWEITKEEENND